MSPACLLCDVVILTNEPVFVVYMARRSPRGMIHERCLEDEVTMHCAERELSRGDSARAGSGDGGYSVMRPDRETEVTA
jgi:hypothetical protein